MKHKNEFFYYIQQSLYTILLLAVSGSVTQAFMQESGIPSEYISAFTSFFQVLQLSVMLMISSKMERTKNLPSASALSYILQTPFCICLLIFCITGGCSNIIFYIIPGILAAAGLGILNVVSYKLPYVVLDMKRYGFVTGVAGVISGIAGIAFSALMSAALNRHSYFSAMTVFAVCFVICSLVCTVLNFVYKTHQPVTVSEAPDGKASLFKDRSFRILLIPNLLRGFNMGIIGLSVTAGYHIGILDSAGAGYLIVLTNVAVLSGSFLYSLIAKRNTDGPLILISSVLCTVFMSLGFASESLFLPFYTIGYLALQLINLAVPVGLTRIVDYSIIGRFTAWRMAINTCGVAISGLVLIPMLDAFGAPVTFLISGIMQIISGSVYFILLRKKKALPL